MMQDLKTDKNFIEIFKSINKINKIIHEELEEKIVNKRATIEDDGKIEKFCVTYSFVNPNLIADYRDIICEQIGKKFKPKIKNYIKLINIVISNIFLMISENKENINNHLQNINNILIFLETNNFSKNKKKLTTEKKEINEDNSMNISDSFGNNKENNEFSYKTRNAKFFFDKLMDDKNN